MAQPQLLQFQTYLNSLLDNIAQGVICIDKSGMMTTCNLAAANMLGISSQKILFHSFWKHFQDKFFGYSMRSALEECKVVSPTSMIIKSGGQPHQRLEMNTFLINRQSMIDSNSEPVDSSWIAEGVMITIREISEIKPPRAISPNEKNTELGEMAAMVAHEIRNPLGGIKGFASLLQRDLIDQPELAKLAAYIVEGTDNLNRLVNDILDFSHPMELTFQQVDLVRLMQELILHLNADESIDPRIELRTHSSQAQLLVAVDAASLKSAMLNLTANAIQAMPEGGELCIELDANDKQAIIRISDTGVGIPKEYMRKIFSPFFTTRPKGHGLGLTEARKIIQAHHGQLEVESDCNVGTTFTIKLPLRRKKSNDR